MSRFNELKSLNVNEKTESKNGLTYLSWTWAWEEFKTFYPDAVYKIIQFDGIPYHYDENTGYMVMTEVTADGETLCMWLPVMDSRNRAMKNAPYKISTRNGEITVQAATMFDINTAIMRCLVKNLAMFGLGLYIYAGEDLPSETQEQIAEKKESLLELISSCKTEEALESLYKEFKTEICADTKLLQLVTLTGKKLKQKGASAA